MFPADLQRLVGAAGIHDDDLVGPSKRLKSLGDVRFLVERDDRGRDSWHRRLPGYGLPAWRMVMGDSR